DAAVDPWGVRITRIEIKDINPPVDLVNAMASQMKAEREKRAVVLEADGERSAAIARAEGEKQSLILAAEGRREAAYLDAEARERSAEAEAKATTSVSAAIESGSMQAINYFVAEKYVAALRDLASAPNQRTLILPVDAVATLGSLAGIAEIARETFGRDGSGPATPPSPSPTPLREVADSVAARAVQTSVPDTTSEPSGNTTASGDDDASSLTRAERARKLSAATEALAARLAGDAR
ncbi:MAG: SPFH domain-containing protein, partial [Pseudomonadota bacterium]